MTHAFPPPPIKPFERLQARDGLLITADRWNKTQTYHRQRQNFHYQSVHQPGVVCGLGVRPIARDGSEPAQYRDGRSFQLQPGIAIDLMGNPIIVPQAENVQVALEPLPEDPLTVYVTVSYRDPEELALSPDQEMMREQFRIDVKTRPPEEMEVEVCRILLPPAQPVQLSKAPDVFFPGYNNVDFRYRQPATLRAQALVRLAQIRHDNPEYNRNFANLDSLLKSTSVLYPTLQGEDRVDMLAWESPDLDRYDLLYLTGQRLSMSQPEGMALQRFLKGGGVVVVDVPAEGSELGQYIAGIAQQQLQSPLEPLSRRHPLRRQPFLFAALPIGAQRQPVQVFVNGGIVMVVGNLGSMWGLDEELSLPRNTIRTAQEFGINLLHYAWQRRLMTGLQD